MEPGTLYILCKTFTTELSPKDERDPGVPQCKRELFLTKPCITTMTLTGLQLNSINQLRVLTDIIPQLWNVLQISWYMLLRLSQLTFLQYWGSNLRPPACYVSTVVLNYITSIEISSETLKKSNRGHKPQIYSLIFFHVTQL